MNSQLDIFGQPEPCVKALQPGPTQPTAPSAIAPGTASAIHRDCWKYQYRVDREIQTEGTVFAYFVIKPSTVDASINEHVERKLNSFSAEHGCARYIVGNVFGLRAKEIKDLATATDPVGPDNATQLTAIIEEADLLIPCWGSLSSFPIHLAHHFDELIELLLASGKPVRIFGHCLSGDPQHPLMIRNVPLIPWSKP